MAYRPRRRMNNRKPRKPRFRLGNPGRKMYARRFKLGKGKITLLRKTFQMALTSTNTAGSVALTSAPVGSTPVINLGTPEAITGGSGTALYNVPFAMKFCLNQIIAHQDITNIADKYRIAGAYVRVYSYRQDAESSDGNYGVPFLHYITDHDDAVAPTSISQLREKMGLKTKTFTNGVSYIGIKCRPVPNIEAYRASGATTGYVVPKYAPYIDCGNDDVHHFGIKGAIMGMPLPGSAENRYPIAFDVSLLIQAKDLQ